MSKSNLGPRFGVWALVPGTWASHHHPEDPFDASWERVKRQIVAAEAQGYDATLIAQHTINPAGEEYGYLEAWAATAALAAITKKIELITAIKPFLQHPVVLAKQALAIEEISQGRFAINVVNGWFKPEAQRSGLPFYEHDERYAYGQEWLAVVRSLVTDERTSYSGKYFNIDNLALRPLSQQRQRPTIYVGGESDPARVLAAELGDTYFINGQPLADVQALIRDVQAKRGAASPIKFGLSAFVIARPTEDEAQEALAQAWEIAELDAAAFAQVYENADAKATMFETFRKYPHIGTNGGTAAGLVGSYEQVVERIHEFYAAGIELFMLQFQPFEKEQQRFSEQIIPRVRQFYAEHKATSAII